MRLLTRSDFDGLACAALLKELGIIDNWKFVHPKDIQDGLIEVNENDVLANIPFAPGCKMWFDHHSSEIERLKEVCEFEGDTYPADSTARVIYTYFKCHNRLPHMEPMVEAVDKVDSARLSIEEILNPTGWILLGFIMDPRTGLGRFRNFRISNYELMGHLIDACRSQSIEGILANPDVKERSELYFEQDALFREMLKKYTTIDQNVIITDLRGVETINAGNRFLVYSLFPEQNISLWIIDGRAKQNCPIAMGHSVINRTSKTDVGSLLLTYGGGGHRKVGTCQVPYEEAKRVISELIAKLKEDG
ncbi:MAG: exopolyphosphatase [Firmicutes bacterium]|nr:exopolyphosphatase [Bacillota bacterium]